MLGRVSLLQTYFGAFMIWKMQSLFIQMNQMKSVHRWAFSFLADADL